VKIYVVGAGQVGTTIVEALHDEHELTVIDLDGPRLASLSARFDVATVEASGASRKSLQEAGIADADLFVACTSRDEINIIASLFARKLAPRAKTIARTTNVEYLEVWHERELDLDFIVSSELETAHAVARIIGIPAARQTDVFADGQVEMVEFEVPPEARPDELIGKALREARIPADSKVASIIRGERAIVPRGDESIQPGDRVVVISSPEAAREWSRQLAGRVPFRDIVIYGAGDAGIAIARVLLDMGSRVRIVEIFDWKATEVARLLPEARVFHATGMDPDFLEREKIGRADAAIVAMRDDAKNQYAATLLKMHGVRFTMAVVHEAMSVDVFERAGIDVAIDPRTITAEEIVRFAHDPRTRQVAMLEGDRYEILDVTVRGESKLIRTPFRELPMTGSLIGAIVRDGRAIFPHGDDQLEPDDRVIVFTEAARATEVEKAL
jgi:trk system potassium uptake protein TrkA